MAVVAVFGSRQNGKSILMRRLKDAGYDVVDEQQLNTLRLQAEATYSFTVIDEALPVPICENLCPDRTPDWKRKKYFGNRRSKR